VNHNNVEERPLMTYYYKNIPNLPLFSLEEQCELAVAAKEGNDEAAGQLVMGVFRLVVKTVRSIAIRYNLHFDHFEDAVHIGVEACYYALTKYKVEEGKWWTYARTWVFKSVCEFCGDRKKAEPHLWGGEEVLDKGAYPNHYNPEEPWSQMERRDKNLAVREALERLPEWEADEFLSYMFLETPYTRSTKEVADHFGVSTTTVYNRLKRFFAFLKQDLEWIL